MGIKKVKSYTRKGKMVKSYTAKTKNYRTKFYGKHSKPKSRMEKLLYGTFGEDKYGRQSNLGKHQDSVNYFATAKDPHISKKGRQSLRERMLATKRMYNSTKGKR